MYQSSLMFYFLSIVLCSRRHIFNIHVKCFLGCKSGSSQWRAHWWYRPELPFPLRRLPIIQGSFCHIEEQETFYSFWKVAFSFSNNMFCSSGNKRRSQQDAARLHGAANYETGPTGSGHWECSQHQLLSVQHTHQPAAACSCEIPTFHFFSYEHRISLRCAVPLINERALTTVSTYRWPW